MSFNCSEIGLIDSYTEFCLPITLNVNVDDFTINKGWIAGAFFLGLVIGIGLTALIARPCILSWQKKKRQDEEEMLMNPVLVASPVKEGKSKFQVIEAVPVADDRKTSKNFFRFKRTKKIKSEDDGEMQVRVEVDDALSRGMVDVLSQTNGMSAEVEMGDQDMAYIVAMERSQEQEKQMLLLKILECMLRKKAAKRLVSDNFVENFIKKTEQDLKDIQNMIDREKEESEEKLKNDNKLAKDPQALESELQALQTQFNVKQSKLQRQYKDKIRMDLIKSSGLSEEDVETVMEKLKAQLANLEQKIGQEQARQRRVLEEQLAKRRQVVEYKDETEKTKEEMQEQRVKFLKELLNEKVMSGQLLERHNDELVGHFEGGLNSLYDDLHKDRDLQWTSLCEQLHKNRLTQMQSLMEKQAKDMALYSRKVDVATNADEIVKGFHDLVSRHHAEQEQLSSHLDEEDFKEMEKLNMAMAKAEEKGTKEELEKVLESLESMTDISSSEANKILQLHNQRMQQYQARQQRDRQAMLQRLQEKLQQRLEIAAEVEAREAQEQQLLIDEQVKTIQKVLASNLDLTDEAKEQILQQHGRNMQALSNQLQLSKLRQQKSLEMKLNQRRARIEELKKEKKDLKKQKQEMSEKEQQKLETELGQQVAKEEQKLEDAKQKAISELRRILAEETAEALRAQDEEIGLMIARLQVGQARRKAILERKDRTLRELQDQMEKRVLAGKGAPGTMTDQLLQQHYNQVEHINHNLQRSREVHSRQLAEKIQQMKKIKEREIEALLQVEAQKEYTDKQQRGAGYASQILMQSFLEQRLQRAMAQLEQEMTSELEKEKDSMNTQMEMELQKELQSQRQNLLTQLAAVSDLSHTELEDAVDAAVTGTRNEKQAKKLVKDLRQGIERAKSSMSPDYSDRHRDGLDLHRARTDLKARDVRGLGLGDRQAARPQSGKQFMRKKPTFEIDPVENDDF